MYLQRDRHIVPPSCSLSGYIFVNDNIDLLRTCSVTEIRATELAFCLLLL